MKTKVSKLASAEIENRNGNWLSFNNVLNGFSVSTQFVAVLGVSPFSSCHLFILWGIFEKTAIGNQLSREQCTPRQRQANIVYPVTYRYCHFMQLTTIKIKQQQLNN